MRKIVLWLVFWQVLNVSAYCETGRTTASGKWPTAHFTCAADHLPMGTRVTLPDGRTWVVEDRFGGSYSDRLDLFMGSEAECWKWGRQYLRCKVEVPE